MNTRPHPRLLKTATSALNTTRTAFRSRAPPATSAAAVVGRYASTVGSGKPLIPAALGLKSNLKAGNEGVKVNESTHPPYPHPAYTKPLPHTAGTYWITLDARPLRTPSGARLAIPANRKILAMLIANEWENQNQVLKVPGLPMTSLASRALDGFANAGDGKMKKQAQQQQQQQQVEEDGEVDLRQGVLNELFRYLDTDTTLFSADHPSTLVRLQSEHWAPLHAWYKDEYDVEIKTYDTLVLGGGNRFKQDEKTKKVLRGVVDSWDAWQIAALERATYSTKSFLIAFALVSGRFTADQAARAAQVEVSSQIELWGEVEDTHDVDYQDIRRQLGSVVCMLVKTT
ncbi:hypothetical protein QFC21_004381 [Naganishia friedmannii]|uniref:Uncharacterized protein n=1 Tax=Naganishia friedmannii TaxID=89922 RepID=A0ACC2VI42_9TREE|nr:hypothetical protein QFC21_004381 [Naganishia friedmannii]